MCLGKASGCSEPKKEKVSLLKRKTNNDRINEMSIDKKAEFLSRIIECESSDESAPAVCEKCSLFGAGMCDQKDIKKWLESEADEINEQET